MPTKAWYQSKTIWFNALTILLAVATYFGWTPDQQLMTNVAGFLVAASPFINLALRFFTHRAIASNS